MKGSMTSDERITLSRKWTTPAKRLVYFFAPDFPGWHVPAFAVTNMDEYYRANEQYRLGLDKFGPNPLWAAVAHALCADLQNREKATESNPYLEPWWVPDEQPKTPEEIYKEMANDMDPS